MQSEFIFRVFLIVSLFTSAEILSYFGAYSLFYKRGTFIRQTFTRRYWTISLVFGLVIFPLFVVTGFADGNSWMQSQNFFIAAVIMLVYLPKLIFGLVWLIGLNVFLLSRIIRKLVFSKSSLSTDRTYKIQFYFTRAGFVMSVIAACFILYGMTYGLVNFQLRKVDVYSANIPEEFDGFKIIQISDLHLGSFNNKNHVLKGLNVITENNPDLIVITGDIVNHSAGEAQPYIDVFRSLKAPFGKYAVLGNHDMDDYLKWGGVEGDSSMSGEVANVLGEMGFKVLRNQNAVIKKNTDSIAIIGVDNWGKAPFRNYADIKKAYKGIENVNCKILLMHDPMPWETSVLPYYDIDLTLSGHTHGMQLGYYTEKNRWSPVSFRYKKFLGLYEINNSRLYINAGFGYLGFAARVGVPPEITLIVLRKHQ